MGRDLFRSEDDPPAAKPATPLLSLRWTFRAKRACVVITEKAFGSFAADCIVSQAVAVSVRAGHEAVTFGA